MRYPAERKAETREKIVATAARSLREQGFETNSIGRVMKVKGLTKDGFGCPLAALAPEIALSLWRSPSE
jgi:hypothetical protein